jgi:putative HNHc nuclease
MSPHRPMLAPQESAKMRGALLAEIERLASAGAAATWASEAVRVKNTLTAEDAQAVETAFEIKLAGLPAEDPGPEPEALPLPSPANVFNPNSGPVVPADAANNSTQASVFVIAKTVYHRNKKHLRFVAMQPCLVCGRQPSDPHHLRFAQGRALGRKVSDEFTVPLCRMHHREIHRVAIEIEWWHSRGIAPLAAAEVLWKKTQSGQDLHEPAASSDQRPQRRRRRLDDVP